MLEKMTKPRVLVLGRAITNSLEFDRFSELVEPILHRFESRESFIEELQTKFSDIEGIWVAQGGFFVSLLLIYLTHVILTIRVL